MFDSVTHPSVRSRFGTGAILSVALHGLALGIALLISAHSEAPKQAEPFLKFIRPALPQVALPSAAPAAAASPAPVHHSHHRAIPRPDQPVVGRQIDPPDVAGVDTEDAPDLDVPGVVGGPITGPSTGPLGLGVAGTVASGPVVYSSVQGMTAPRRLSGKDPTYTREALAAGVQGTLIARCVITEAGLVTGCRVVKGLPYLDKAVVRALETQRFRPVTLNGRPIAVEYLFTIKMVLPGR